MSRILYFALRRNENTNESQLISEHILRSLRGKLAWLIYDMSLIKEKRPTLNRHSKPIPFPQNFSLDYFILLLFKFNVVSHTVVSYIYIVSFAFYDDDMWSPKRHLLIALLFVLECFTESVVNTRFKPCNAKLASIFLTVLTL